MKPRLVVFARAPVIGGAKTRLAAGVGKVAAWRQHRAMTAKILREVCDARWETVIAASPDRALKQRFPRVWPDRMLRLDQGEGDLGARQARVFGGAPAATLPRGARSRRGARGPVCIIGTDAPQVSRADIAEAFTALKRHDAVIGPAEDGGYWLLALNAPAPAGLFHGVRWSHPRTRADLTAQLTARGLGSIAQLRSLRDIDEAADLRAVAVKARRR